jgi:hypothetical protein
MLFESSMKLTEAEIEAGRSAKGGFTKEQLGKWGVSWPPRKGWRRALILGCRIDDLPAEQEPEPSESVPDSIEGKLFHQVVMAVINAGQADLLCGLYDVNAYYNCALPTVADVVGGRPETAIIDGGITWDDKVYRFSVARLVKQAAA